MDAARLDALLASLMGAQIGRPLRPWRAPAILNLMCGRPDGTIQVLSAAPQCRKNTFAILAAAACRGTVIFGMRVEDIQYFMDHMLLPAWEVVIAGGLDPPTVVLRAPMRTCPDLTGLAWLVCPRHSVVQGVATFTLQTVMSLVTSDEYVHSG
jgi:hypothetical protein